MPRGVSVIRHVIATYLQSEYGRNILCNEQLGYENIDFWITSGYPSMSLLKIPTFISYKINKTVSKLALERC